MELIERSGYLDILHKQLKQTARGEGFIFFLIGEAGIGKTSLVQAFMREAEDDCQVYTGTCDSLFTPRPLAPLFDIAYQIGGELPALLQSTTDKSTLFAAFLQKLTGSNSPIVLVFEDIHWADEVTLDFIKFLARRIHRSKILFILTFRDNEISENLALRNVLGDLSPDVMQKITLPPLSRQAVKKLAATRGYSGEDVYNISGGIPFYVNEILASYSPGIPRNIKDAVLAVYNRGVGLKKDLWELFSVAPDGLEINLLEKISPHYGLCLEQCLDNGVLLTDRNTIRFKHELYRRTVEEHLSPLKRLDLHKKVLDLLLQSNEPIRSERIVHHAKNANAYEVVMKYAPQAAEQAVQVGAHVEASKLFLTAIEYAPRGNPVELVNLYEQYAYECYLTNQVKEAIIYQQRALRVYRERNEVEKTGNSLRILSRLWWFEANGHEAEKLGHEAITVLENEPSSAVKAMAYSNMSQLKMLSDEHEDSIYWGEIAINMANELGNHEILSHALCNVGAVKMRKPETQQEGEKLLLQSLDMALKHGFHDHAGRSYTCLCCNALLAKDYMAAQKYFDAGISYCNERDLDNLGKYMLGWKARMLMETGQWTEATDICTQMAYNESYSAVTRVTALNVLGRIKLRSGHEDALQCLEKAKALAFPSGEVQRIAPVMVALLEYEWHTGREVVTEAEIDNTVQLAKESDNRWHYSEFAYWLEKARDIIIYENDLFKPYQLEAEDKGLAAAAEWKKIGCPYEEAHALFTGGDDDKRNALAILTNLGATATHEKMKQEMRTAGIRNIPRGLRETTRSNPAQLTTRQVDVLKLLHAGLQNKEIAGKLFISAKTVDHHISAILFKLDVNSRTKAVSEGIRLGIIK
jgi:DNA-binding CsgD family transcriptional regulator/tetratricopeptide (TPR) repeat protein